VPADPSPLDDVTPLTQAAIALHEVYCALLAGGFAEHQALRVVAHMIAEEGEA
jgi:hypothetical protein